MGPDCLLFFFSFFLFTDKALAWFGHFGGDDTGDDSGNILDFKRKDYRDLINKNVISVFDFRCYLFARQSRMLIKLQRVVEACSRAQLFISSFIPSIRENKVRPLFLWSRINEHLLSRVRPRLGLSNPGCFRPA